MPIKKVGDVTVVRDGKQIVLPEGMSYDDGIVWLQRRKAEEEAVVKIQEVIHCAPYDGIVALKWAMERIYGFTLQADNGDGCPVIQVATGVDETESVPIGYFKIPNIPGGLYVEPVPAGVSLLYETKKKHEKEVRELFAMVKTILAAESIYKGKALRIDFSKREQVVPNFMRLDSELEKTLHLPAQAKADVQNALYTPIEHTEACRRHGVPLKRGILLYGKFGTGKTLTATVAAIKAVRAGWTYLYIPSADQLSQALEFAKRYAPAVVFVEDIDRATSGGRTEDLDRMLNTIDGVEFKNAEIITVFTTNDIDAINPAMIRMGRLDAIIEIAPPDADAAQALLRHYAGNTLAPDCNLSEAGRRLNGKIPAFIREVAERSKLAAIGRLNGADITGQVIASDIVQTADLLEAHDVRIWKKAPVVARNAEVLVRIPATDNSAAELLNGVKNGSYSLIQ